MTIFCSSFDIFSSETFQESYFTTNSESFVSNVSVLSNFGYFIGGGLALLTKLLKPDPILLFLKQSLNFKFITASG